jgi:hypothetical protein
MIFNYSKGERTIVCHFCCIAMKHQQLKYILLAFMLFPAFAYAQKAYDAVKYTGSVQNISVKFTLANGYLAGCTITTADNNTHKRSQFLPEEGSANENKTLKFYHRSASGKTFTDYFTIKGLEEIFETAPAKIYGSYYFNGKAYNLVLKQ